MAGAGGIEGLHAIDGTCDLCGECCDSETQELNALTCTFAPNCPEVRPQSIQYTLCCNQDAPRARLFSALQMTISILHLFLALVLCDFLERPIILLHKINAASMPGIHASQSAI
jgi:hypothetical protein